MLDSDFCVLPPLPLILGGKRRWCPQAAISYSICGSNGKTIGGVSCSVPFAFGKIPESITYLYSLQGWLFLGCDLHGFHFCFLVDDLLRDLEVTEGLLQMKWKKTYHKIAAVGNDDVDHGVIWTSQQSACTIHPLILFQVFLCRIRSIPVITYNNLSMSVILRFQVNGEARNFVLG